MTKLNSTYKAKKNVDVTVTLLTLIFGPDPKRCYGAFNRELFEMSHFHFQKVVLNIKVIVILSKNVVIVTHGW